MDNLDILIGNSEAHLTKYNENYFIHKEALGPFNALKLESQKEGLDLEIVSSFRSFERQLKIWNDKASGKRDVLDDESNPIDISTISKEELLFKILRWSALPGLSRHHWGSDIDIIDATKLKDGYKVQLIPSEAESGGVFCKIHEWLTDRIDSDNAFGFYRPYQKDKGGVSPELWHLSYRPVSDNYYNSFTYETFEVFLNSQNASSIELLDEIKRNAKEIYERFFLV